MKPEIQKSSRPIKTEGYCSDMLHAKRDRKRAEAEERNALYAGLPFEEKIKCRGGFCGKRQMDRLEKRAA